MSKMHCELEFEDTFDADVLDGRRLVPHYLPQWSSRGRSAARYEVGGGRLRLLVDADQQPWCPELDGEHVKPYPKEFIVDYVRGYRRAPG